MRKVYVDVKVRLVINMDEGMEVSDVIDDIDYGFISQTDGATVEDESIEHFEVVDSK